MHGWESYGILDIYVHNGFTYSIFNDRSWTLFYEKASGKNEDCTGTIGGIICGLQTIPLIGSLFPTELALKKNFDKDGKKR